MVSRDGNGWVRCGLGHRHWGRFGAAGLLAYVAAGPVLLQHRVWWSHHGGTWGLPGGARDSHESALAAALREAAEECGVPPGAVRQTAVFTDDHGGWSYTTVLAQAAGPFDVESDNHESDEVTWVPSGEVAAMPLHPGLSAHWAELEQQLSPLTLIVDSANVVGSRPDGWWRDREGATRRLAGQLAGLAEQGIVSLPAGMPAPKPAGPAAAWTEASAAPADPAGPAEDELARMGDGQILMRWLPQVLLVVEGSARPVAGAGAGRSPGGALQVVGAPGSGDDTVAGLAARTAGRRVVVTADRELRERCAAAGADVAGPGWLLRELG